MFNGLKKVEKGYKRYRKYKQISKRSSLFWDVAIFIITLPPFIAYDNFCSWMRDKSHNQS